MKKKIWIAGALIMICIIGWFSSQSSVDSNELSKYFLKWIGLISESEWQAYIETGVESPKLASMNLMIRKMAHFTLYFVLGLCMALVLCYFRKFDRRGQWLTVITVGMIGLCDEVHQYFVPGRYMDMRDVMTDTLGGICAVLLISIVKHNLKMKQVAR